MKTISYLFALIFIVSVTTNTDAQIGSLNKLKNKAKNSVKKKKSSSSSNVAVSKYSKYMNEGYKYKDEKKYVEALSSFNNALKEKPGDYSAKNQVQQMESKVKDKYLDLIDKNISDNKCDKAEENLDIAVKALGSWNQEKYLRTKIDKCKANAGANASAAATKAKTDALAAGSGSFYTDFAKKDFKKTVSVGDNLFVKFKFAKVMTEYFKDFGMEDDFNAYGYFTVYINGKKIFVDGPYQFGSNYSKVWTDFDVPLCVDAVELSKKIKANPDMLSTGQDIWLFQQISNPTGISNKFTMAAIQNMSKNGTYKVKVEFGIGEKPDYGKKNGKPKGTIASGEVTVKVDDAGRKELYKRGPKYMRPLEDNEKGKWVFNNNSYELGKGELTVTLDMPQPPKYYNMKWCKSSSCDYDHGELMFAVFIDGKYLANWQTTFWNDKYETQKKFSSIMFTVDDKDFGDDLSKFNSSDFFIKVGNDNPVVYGIYDMLYAGKLNAGKHTLTFKAMSPESVPPNTTFEASKKYFDQLPVIAENTLNFNVTASTKNNIVAKSSAKKLKHAGGSWASVDAYLKKSSTDGEATIIDVATNTQWKVTVNSLGTPLYRTCKANVLYKSKNGFTRLIRGVDVKEDYQGNSKYSQPYFTDRMNNYYTANPGFLNDIHYPVPYSKVK